MYDLPKSALVLFESMFYVSPHRNSCDMRTSEKCVPGLNGVHDPVPVQLDMYVALQYVCTDAERAAAKNV